MILNLIRGTGRKGLSSLRSSKDIVRPLLGHSKEQILKYARLHNIEWREDKTNSDQQIIRNWVRYNVISKLDSSQRKNLVSIYNKSIHTNQEIDDVLSELYDTQSKILDKQVLLKLSHLGAKELVAHWLRSNDLREFTNKHLEKIVLNSKTLKYGKESDIYGGYKVLYGERFLSFIKD